MALSATFTANFASFYDAVDKATTKLDDFQGGADKAGERLNRMAQSFSGQKIVQEATLMVKAIGGVEGITNLTEKEMARLGATTNEAVEKLKKLGKDVPKDLQDVANATKGANKQTTDWLGTLTKAAGAVGIAFSVGAITNFIGSVFDAAGAIADMSDQWGVSTTAVQQWTQAAKASGVEADTVGKGVQFITENLSESSDAYEALLKNVGLSGDKLRGMKLEDSVTAVLKAIEDVEDETLQLDLALGLLGPSAKKWVGAIRDGFLETAAAEKVMADETVARLAKAGDAWQKLWNNVTIWSGEAIASVLQGTSTALSSSGTFFKTITLGLKDFITGGQGSAAAFLQATGAIQDFGAGTVKATKDIHLMTAAEIAAQPVIKTTAQIHAELAAAADKAKKAEQARTQALAASKADQDAYNKAVDAYKKTISDLANNLSGGVIIAKANEYLEALKTSIPVMDMTRAKQEEINKAALAAIEVYEAAGREVPQAIRDMASATEQIVPLMIQKRDQIRDVWQGFTLPLDLGKVITLDPAPPPVSMFDGFTKGLAGSLSSSVLKAIQGGGNILQAAGSAVGSFILDPKQSGVGKAITTAASKLPGLIGGAVSAAIPVVGAFIGPAVTWLAGKITSWFGKKEHEKLRDSFIEAAGGIDVLRDAAELAGVELDDLMRARNTDKVKGAITEIEAALKFQATALDQAIEAAKRYGFTLEELGPAMARQELDKQAQQLFRDWEILNSAGIESVAITERMSEAVSEYVQHASAMGLEVPNAMRPMLEAFAKSGNLLDENGEAITDLEQSGLRFSMTMSEGFTRLIDEVHRLTDAISRSLGRAIEEVPPVEVRGRVTWEVDPIGRPNDMAYARSSEGLPEYDQGTKGFKNFGAGTPVMLHGWEAVVPRDDAGAFATVAAGGGSSAAAAAPVQVIINAQGALFDTPGDLQRLADRVSTALSAKDSLTNKRRAA